MSRKQLRLSQLGNPQNISSEIKDRSVQYRDRIDMLRGRLELLSGQDRVLLKMYLENGTTFRQMAAVAGVNEATIARRIYKLIRRLLDGEYIICLRNRKSFTRLEMQIAKNYFLDGLSQRKISLQRKCSVYRVRQTLKKIESKVSRDSV